MVAMWLVGTEHSSRSDAGEICIAEIDAEAIGASTVARCGIKAHHDPRLADDMTDAVLPFDARHPHTWTLAWGNGETLIGCEGRIVRRMPQAPGYPLVLMIGMFEIGAPGGTCPKTAVIHRARGWSG